ncbi:MAG TPA: transposase [Candidatus Acidoferrum sp.]|nr:transposase [Candidatus Acidoferrum sp.]
MHLAPQETRTFFVTSVTSRRHAILQSAQMSSLLLNVLDENRTKGRFLLHEFVIMPDHFHLLLTPSPDVPLEKAVQYIKGGFSFRAGRDLGFKQPVWQESFTNHRIRDAGDYQSHRGYIWNNPVKRFLAERPDLFPYSSAHPGAQTDPVPPWLKP